MPHMSSEEFRRHGHQVVDWIADYWSSLTSRPVVATTKPGDVAGALQGHAPEYGEPFESILADLDRVIAPGITHWQHPRFFGYFPANTSGPAVLGDLVSSGLGVNGLMWAASPACTELEQVVLDWLAELLGLPPEFGSAGPGGGVIQDTASTATLVAILAALHQATDGRSRADGLAGIGRPCAIYASTQAHSSIQKAAMIAGIGESGVRLVDVDPHTQAMRPDLLRQALAADRAAGVLPVAVVAAVGTTSTRTPRRCAPTYCVRRWPPTAATTAVDPVAELGPICREYGVWLHVDAAYAGVAALCPELRWIHDGVGEYADSYTTNPHKWLLTTFDCNAFWVRDRAALLGALSILPEYLRNPATESGAVVDYRDWGIQLGRRFRALKLWFVLRSYGAEGLRTHIRHHVALAGELAGWVEADDRFELAAAHPLGLVCFRQVRAGDGSELPDDAADSENLDLMHRLNGSGRLFLTHTRVNGRVALRMAIGSPQTTAADVRSAWDDIRSTAI